MLDSHLQRRLETLQAKRDIVIVRLYNCESQLEKQQQALEELTNTVQASRLTALKTCEMELARWNGAPPARSGDEDVQRLATVALRPLTPIELQIAAMKKPLYYKMIATINPTISFRLGNDIRHLRRQAWFEWENVRRTLQHDVDRCKREVQENRDTTDMRNLRILIADLQRECNRLDMQADFLKIDIEAVQDQLDELESHARMRGHS